MRIIIAALLFLYQKTISPDHGVFFWSSRRCRFFPSCSEYAKQALRQYGLLRGGVLSAARIISCGPWSAGGYAPLPSTHNKSARINEFVNS
jgi:uncharacterized protein